MPGESNVPPTAVVQVVLSLDRGGLETMAVDLAVALTVRGIRSAVIALDEGGVLEPTLREAGVDYVVMGGRRFKNPRFHIDLASQFHRRRPCVAHTHMFAPLLHALPALTMARASGIVHTEHSFEYLEPRPSFRRLLRWMSRATRAFTLVGERMRPYYLNAVGISPRRLQVIPNGIEARRYRPLRDHSSLRADLGLPTDEIIVGSAGRLAPEKNYGMLLEAVAQCRASGIPMHAALFGEGSERARLEAHAQALGIGSAVSFMGWRTDLYRVLGALDVFVLTSESEGLPLALLEAMATGLPSVCTPVGDVPRILDEGRTGLLVPVGDAAALSTRLMMLCRDSERRKAIGYLARTTVIERFSHDAMVDRYIAAYGLEKSNGVERPPALQSVLPLSRDAVQ